jgi:UDP:flavonoid glycosyltransferase YjiC (YdhE family)
LARPKKRGHRVTLICPPSGALFAQRAGLEFAPAHVAEHETGELDREKEDLAALEGYQAFRLTISLFVKLNKLWIRDLPGILDELKCDALLLDETVISAFSIA